MKTKEVMPLTQMFVSISDPRSARQVRHDLSELLTVAVCAVLCSADEFSDIEAWAEERIDWLQGFLVLKHGIPSHDTFGRVFAMLDPREFEAAFRRWVGQLLPALSPDAVVAIDGKASRGSTPQAAAHPLHLVSAFAADIGLVLGQTATAEKSNEITAIPELLATLALNGCVVTIDAMGTQTAIAKTIRERGADYVLCVKDNHPKLVESFLLAQAGIGGVLTPSSTTESREEGHGRTEVRRCWAFDAVDRLYKAEQWADLKSFAIVERERTMGTRTSHERCYYISSLPADAPRIARAVRSHWEVENRLHWCLDVQFGEDQATVRTGFAANNLAIVRHIVMNLLRLNTSRKGSIKTKRMLAATSDIFRAELLGLMT
ncbi:MAG: ISAs1 family transposase [Proteobacteria bacterium]|nr:ISAs1 family transposase [Pseudomonadota bacterium]